MQIAQTLGQFENSVFLIVGNWGKYMPYRYIPFGESTLDISICPLLYSYKY